MTKNYFSSKMRFSHNFFSPKTFTQSIFDPFCRPSRNFNSSFSLSYPIMTSGDRGVPGQKTCKAQFEKLIAVVLTLFTECENSTWFRRNDQCNFSLDMSRHDF